MKTVRGRLRRACWPNLQKRVEKSFKGSVIWKQVWLVSNSVGSCFSDDPFENVQKDEGQVDEQWTQVVVLIND